MTPSEQELVEAALKTAYRKGFTEARYYPHRRMPDLHVDWGQDPHVLSDWGDTGLTPVEIIHTRLDGTAP